MPVKLSKSAINILKFLRDTPPNLQGQFYDLQRLPMPKSLFPKNSESAIILRESIERLFEVGALKQQGKNYLTFRMTDIGRNWREYHWMNVRENIWKSVVVPIIVSLLTNLAVHGTGLLLPLVSEWLTNIRG